MYQKKWNVMQNFGHRRSVQKDAQNAGSNVLKIGPVVLEKMLTPDRRRRTPTHINRSPEWLKNKTFAFCENKVTTATTLFQVFITFIFKSSTITLLVNNNNWYKITILTQRTHNEWSSQDSPYTNSRRLKKNLSHSKV